MLWKCEDKLHPFSDMDSEDLEHFISSMLWGGQENWRVQLSKNSDMGRPIQYLEIDTVLQFLSF